MRKMKFDFPTVMLVLFVVTVGFSSCKSKKKLSEVSDQDEISEQIEEEMESMDEEETMDEGLEEETSEPRVATYNPSTSDRLHGYFSNIANATSTATANREIREALGLFTNGNAPVLIIFYRADGSEDYDEPTSIEKYLNYLKDTGNNEAKVEEMVTAENGKIKELVLVKE